MAKNKLTDLQQLSLDVYTGSVKDFSVGKGEDAIRKAIETACGGEWNIYSFKKNKYDVYQVIAEVLTLPIQKSMEGLFDGLVEVDSIGRDEMKTYDVPNTDLFKVASVSAGNSDIRRDKIFHNKVTVETGSYEIKIYDDLDRFLAGKVNFSELVDRVRRSLANFTSGKIYESIYNSYSILSSTYGINGSFAEDKLNELVAHVSAKTNMPVAIYGTKKALAKISSGTTTVPASENMKDDYNSLGFFREFQGTPMIEMPQVHINGTDTFFLKDDVLFILPIGLKPVKLVYEGEPIVDDTQNWERRNDRQIEFLFAINMGVAVLVANYYGIYKLV